MKICTGQSLSDHLVATVFQIFDEDGDGQLSYKEFIAIMRDRLHRGIKVSRQSNIMAEFHHFILAVMSTACRLFFHVFVYSFD